MESNESTFSIDEEILEKVEEKIILDGLKNRG